MEHDDKKLVNELRPGYHGENCPGNGFYVDVECQCDECEHFLSCFPDWNENGFWEKMQLASHVDPV